MNAYIDKYGRLIAQLRKTPFNGAKYVYEIQGGIEGGYLIFIVPKDLASK